MNVSLFMTNSWALSGPLVARSLHFCTRIRLSSCLFERINVGLATWELSVISLTATFSLMLYTTLHRGHHRGGYNSMQVRILLRRGQTHLIIYGVTGSNVGPFLERRACEEWGNGPAPEQARAMGRPLLVAEADSPGQFALAGSGRTGRTTSTTTQYGLDAFALLLRHYYAAQTSMPGSIWLSRPASWRRRWFSPWAHTCRQRSLEMPNTCPSSRSVGVCSLR